MDMNTFARLMAMQQPAAAQKPFVEFKAGMMNNEPIRGTNKLRMAADPRKGMLTVGRDPSDGAVHVKWIDRNSGNPGMDIMVFPDDVTFKRINTGTATDRVYELKYKAAGSRAFYFWMQTAEAKDDDANAKKLIDAIDRPPMDGGASGAGGDADMNDMLAGLSRGPAGASGVTTRAGGARPAAGAPAIGQSQLSEALAALGVGTRASPGIGGTPSTAASPPPAPAPSGPPPSATAVSAATGVGFGGGEAVPSLAAMDPGARPSPAPAAAPAAGTGGASGAAGGGADDIEMALAGIEDEELREAIRLSMMEAQSQGGQGNNNNNNSNNGQGGQGGGTGGGQ